LLLSTKGRYGLKATFELALNYGKGPLSLKSISQKYNISENYLEQLLSKVRKKGYIKTVRGVNGGYLLALEPSEITIGMILRALEGEMSPSDCLSSEMCSRESICATRVIFEKIEKSINDVIDNTYLIDMVNQHSEVMKEHSKEL
jgi:Rrf2 family protein